VLARWVFSTAGEVAAEPEAGTETPRAVLDPSLLESACGGDREVRAEFVSLFLETAGNELDGLRDALADADAPRVKSLAHSLAGGAATLGAFRLSGACNRLSQLAATGELEGADARFEEVESAFYLTREELADLVGDAAETSRD
jgi:HPt (histidine-containing phosphotransfer) domain-containing protein